jgi:protein TonB
MKKAFQYLLLYALISGMIVLNSATVTAQEMHNSNSMPLYAGGNEALSDFLARNIHYPENAVNAGISGIVEVSYVVNGEGKVQNIKVVRGIHPECDAEAIRVTGLLSGWTPGIRQGKPVSVMVKMPVEFKGTRKVKPGVIEGKVTEKSNGQPVEGAFVVIKGTNIGTVTNGDGWYRLEVTEENQYLDFFSVGYSFQEVPIDFHSTLNVELDSEYLIVDFNAREVK